MLEDVLGYLRNWFCVERVVGTFVIDKGRIAFPEGATVPDNQQYIRVFGSVFNDGLHMAADDTFTDETFEGTVWLLAVPTPVVQIAQEVEAYQASVAEAGKSPYKSESFDGYSYQLRTDANGCITSWQEVFRNRLARWRKI